MHSYLSRRVFLRLLAGKPLVFHRPIQTRVRHLHKPLRIGQNAVPKRTFFGMFSRPRDQPKFDPGLETMLKVDRQLHEIGRLPKPPELLRAFRAFVASKDKMKQPIQDLHARLLLQTFEALEHVKDSSTGEPLIDAQTLKDTLSAISRRLNSFEEVHAILAVRLYNALKSTEPGIETSPTNFAEVKEELGRLGRVVIVFCNTGKTAEAVELLKDFYSHNEGWRDHSYMAWVEILESFRRAGTEQQLLQTLDTMKSLGVPLTQRICQTVTEFYADNNNIAQTKAWYQSFAEKNGNAAEDTTAQETTTEPETSNGAARSLSLKKDFLGTLLRFCIRNNELKWADEVLEPSLQKLSGNGRQSFLALAAAREDRGIDEIHEMVAQQSQNSPNPQGSERPWLNTYTYNALLEQAIAKGDAYAAERVWGQSSHWNIKLNTYSYIKQIELRILAKDVNGAVAAYIKLREQTIKDDEDWDVMNKLLQFLTEPPRRPDHTTIMGLVEDITERQRTFPADTVHALCIHHIQRGEILALTDLLQTYSYQYSTAERTKIRDILAHVTLDEKAPVALAWDIYEIFSEIFDLETKRDMLEKCIDTFFKRKRADLSLKVFLHMHAHVRKDTRPDENTYAITLFGAANAAHDKTLETVHNYLKLETDVEPTTRLLNTLMFAYTRCGEPVRGYRFWSDIEESAEGPNYKTFHMVFRTCEGFPQGLSLARALWQRLQTNKVQITKALFENFISVLGAHHQLDEAATLINSDMVKVTGVKPDWKTIATFYNSCCLYPPNQQTVERWAKNNFPARWAECEAQTFITNVQDATIVKGVYRDIIP